MTQRGPWSVKGIDSRAREVAREAAREEGTTLGAYLNRLILEEGSVDPGAPYQKPASAKPAQPRHEPRQRSAMEPSHAGNEPSASALDRLTRRIESAEARSTLAITGIDQSVVGLLSRLENAEHSQQAMGGHFEGVMDDIHKTYEALNLKVKRVEEDDSSATNLKALKALEDALGKLASHVYEENELVSEETSAIKGRLESGLHELGDRMDDIDSQIQGKLAEATDGFNQSVQEAELRTEGISKHLAERFTSVEVDVADKLTHVGQMSATMDSVHKQVTGDLASMENTLGQVQERLSRAETLTDKAMHGLESRFEALDSRLADVQSFANAEVDQKMRRAFEERFENLSEDLRKLVAATRAELAEEIEAAAKSVDAEVLTKLDGAISNMATRLDSSEDMHAQTMEMVGDTVARMTDSVDQRLTANQDQQARAIEQVGLQVSRISDGLDQRLEKIEEFSGKAESDALREEMIRFTNTLDERLEYLESREDATFDKVSSEVEKLADRLDERVTDSETRSANAIQQVGEQVASVANRIEQRQTEALKAFSAKLDGTQKRQDARLTGALSNVSDRLERMQEQSLLSMSPVQKAIAALAQRLEAIEDFSAPPYAERSEAPIIPDMVSPSKVDTNIISNAAEYGVTEETAEQYDTDELQGFLSPIFSSDNEDQGTPETAKEDLEDIDLLASGLADDFSASVPNSEKENPSEAFEPGFQSWADDANAVLDDTLGIDKSSTSDKASQAFSDLPPPMMDAVEGDPIWNDGREEARDTDIFEDDPSPPNLGTHEEALGVFEDAADYVEPATEPYEEDYITQARRAARNAADNTGTTPGGGKKKAMRGGSEGISSKRAGMAALAAVAVVGTAGALYLRGQNETPAVNFNTNANAVNSETNSIEDTPKTEASGGIETALLTNPDEAVTEVALDAALASATPNAPDETDIQDLASLPPTSNDATANLEPETAEPTLIPDPTPASSSVTPTIRPQFSAPSIPTRITLGRAAQDGNRIAQFQSGMANLRSGSFVTGVDWLRKSADQGLAIAQHEMAILHENGTGVTRDATEARRWHGVAARSGNIEAMFDFATYNANGEGGEANPQVSAEWFRKAAEFGHTDSQYNLAQLFTEGLGVSPSQIEALFWFELAARSGDVDALEKAGALVASGRVSQEATIRVRQRIANWRPATKNAAANGEFGPQPWSGNSAEQTLAVQHVLAALGYSVGTPDGVIGAQTRTAIRSFESSAGIPVTGQINERLVEALNAAADTERRRT